MKRKYGILLLSNAWTGGRFCEVLRPFHLKKNIAKPTTRARRIPGQAV